MAFLEVYISGLKHLRLFVFCSLSNQMTASGSAECRVALERGETAKQIEKYLKSVKTILYYTRIMDTSCHEILTICLF